MEVLMSTHLCLSYHFIFSTKNREPLIADAWRARLHDYFGGCIHEAGGVCLAVGGTADHVHIFSGLKATHCVAVFMRDIKRATSAWIHETFEVPRFAWQEGYGGFTVSGFKAGRLRQYIRDQEEHHRTRTFQEEYRAILDELGVEYDERYLW
jgi:REP element-mobilizing transposase RayT